MNKEFTETGYGNLLYTFNDYIKVSYNPNIKDSVWDDILVVGGLAKSREGKDETALIIDGKYFILNGDFRDLYLECDTRDDFIRVYEFNKGEYQSDFSSDKDLLNKEDEPEPEEDFNSTDPTTVAEEMDDDSN